MTVGHVNVKDTIERIQKEISKDKSISPILVSSIELLIIVIQMLFDRQSMNSSNSSLSPSTDNKRRSKVKDKKREERKVKILLVVKKDIRDLLYLNMKTLMRLLKFQLIEGLFHKVKNLKEQILKQDRL